MLLAAATAALAGAAGSIGEGGGNVAAVRSDLRAMETRLARAMTRIGAQRIDLGALHGAEARALEQFPPVFGRAYAQTFLPLACVSSQPARARACARALVRVLGASSASARVRIAARSLGAAAGRRSNAELGRAESMLIHRFPNVFGLPYPTTFTSLACIQFALSQADALVRRRPGSRKPLLASLRRANGCARLLEAELAPIKTGAPSTAPTLQATPATSTTLAPVGGPPGGTPIYRDTHYSFAERAADLVSRMTLAEKVAQLRTDSAPAISRLGVQQYTYWSEGQHGVNALGANTNHGGASGGPHATSFPTNFAAAMTWDPGLMYQETTAISDEVRGFLDKSLWGTGQNNLGPSAADYGSLTFWAPTVNMDRDPRWGRTDEAFGEDPYLVSQMAGAFVDGYQGETITGQPMGPYLKVAATAKHFALNDVENNRQAISSGVDDTDLHDYYTAQFRSLIEDTHVSGLMTSLNAINGTPAMADTYTDNLVAQRTYGFDGYTTSDCALSNIYRSSPNGHNWAPLGWRTDGQDEAATWTNSSTGATVSGAAGAEAYALRAGTDLNCPGRQATLANIEQAIAAGVLSQGVIDNALIHVFTTRMRTGEFDPPAQVPYTSITKSAIQSPAHQALARQVADNSLVLLQNDNLAGTTAPLLPADPSHLSHVAILGDLASKVTLGGYSGSPWLQVSPVQGIENALGSGVQVYYDAAGTSTTSSTAVSLSAQTQQAIKAADLVIVVVGTDAGVAGEGHDRSTIAMPGNYGSLISQVAAVGNPRMALVVQSDGPVGLAGAQSDFPAIVFSGYNGESQGDALADVLFGRQDPSGHLDFTWYADDSQLPAMSNYGLSPGSTGGLGRTYMYFTGTPTYPFGYGLSYTKFSFSKPQTSAPTVSADGTETLTFDVTNAGAVPGATVAQLYAATPAGLGANLPVKRLEAFEKTRVLQPGETQTISLNVPISRLELWDQPDARWGVPSGTYAFQLGPDAGHVAQSVPVTVTGELTPHVQYVTVQPPAALYEPGDTLDLTGKNPWLADDTSPPSPMRADNIVEAVNTDGSFVDLARAQVSYTSSNDSVARVTSDGVLTAEAPGVATISVSVGGVTGSAVIVVKRPLSLAVPAVTQSGSTFTATETLVNTGASAIGNASLALGVPAGWGTSATSPTSFTSVPPGGSVQATWSVTSPAGAAPGSYELDATASLPDGTETDPAIVAIPYSSLGAAYDNVGISDDGNPAAGDLDGGGRSYSAQDLAAAALSPGALSPGAPITHDGLTFTWPGVPAGMPDDASANGQAIAVSGSGSRLGFLGAGDFGTATGTGTVVYSDGSTQPFGLALADWWANKAAPGGDILKTIPHVNTAGGQQTRNASVYFASVALDPAKTVSYVILPPDVSQGTAGGTTEMHVFSIAVG